MPKIAVALYGPSCHLTDFIEDSSVFLVIRLKGAVEKTFKMEKS